MIYVGVDPSITNTGVVILNSDGNVIEVLNTKGVKNNNPYLLLKDITNTVINFLKKINYDDVKICYEDYSYSSVNRTYRLGELGGVLRSELVANFGNIHLVAPRLLKKFAVNTGDADKAAVTTAALQEDSYFKTLTKQQLTSDICDAYYLARICFYLYNWQNIITIEPNKKLLRQRIETLRGYYSDCMIADVNFPKTA